MAGFAQQCEKATLAVSNAPQSAHCCACVAAPRLSRRSFCSLLCTNRSAVPRSYVKVKKMDEVVRISGS